MGKRLRTGKGVQCIEVRRRSHLFFDPDSSSVDGGRRSQCRVMIETWGTRLIQTRSLSEGEPVFAFTSLADSDSNLVLDSGCRGYSFVESD